MKTTSNIFNLFCIGILAMIAMKTWSPRAPATALAMAPSSNACETGRSVQVSGAAVVYVTPDRALI